MRYRRLSYRYTMLMRSGLPGPFDDLGQTDRVRLPVGGIKEKMPEVPR